MRRFLRVLKENGDVAYLNLDRIDRVEIQNGTGHALIYPIGSEKPIEVKEDEYRKLVEILGDDQVAV